MNTPKTFTEYKNDYLCTENYSINQYQYMIKKVLKELGVQLYFATTFGTSLTVLIPLVNSIMVREQVEIDTKDIILITIFVLSVLTKESKDKVAIILKKITDNGINKTLIDKVFNVFKNIELIFIEVSLLLGKVIERFADMIVYTSVFVPFINILSSLIDNEQLDINLLYQSLDVFKITMGSIAIKLLMNKIIKKLNIMLNHDDKFQNVDNVKPLLVNQQLKAKMFQTDKYSAK